MPIYEYKCKKCERVFEEIQSVNDPPKTKCISCDGDVVKIISPVGIVFKGSGFHKTDYGSKNTSSKTTKTEEVKKDIDKKVEDKKETTTKTETPKDKGDKK